MYSAVLSQANYSASQSLGFLAYKMQRVISTSSGGGEYDMGSPPSLVLGT